MKIKVGDIVRNAVEKSGLFKGDFLKALDKSRPWFTTVLKDDYMQLKYIIQIGEIAGVDFSESIPELKKYLENGLKQQNIVTENFELKFIEMQDKYVKLLEQHVKLLNDFKSIKD